MSAAAWWGLFGIAFVSFVLSVLGATVGLVLGHFRLPLLVAYLGSAPAGAATNLAISGLGAAAGSFRHLRDGRVSAAAVALMGLPSAAGAVLGVLLFTKVDRFWAHVVLGALLAFVGYRMFRPRPSSSTPPPAPSRGPRLLVEVGIGLFLGVLSSVTGLMMNSLRLPMMIRALRLDPAVAVGSNMAIGLLTAVVGAASSWWLGGGFDWLALLVVGPPTMLGSYAGARLTGLLRKEALERLLGGTIAVMGLVMVAQGFAKATRVRDLQPAPATAAEAQLLEDEDDEWPDWPDFPDWFDLFGHAE